MAPMRAMPPCWAQPHVGFRLVIAGAEKLKTVSVACRSESHVLDRLLQDIDSHGFLEVRLTLRERVDLVALASPS